MSAVQEYVANVFRLPRGNYEGGGKGSFSLRREYARAIWSVLRRAARHDVGGDLTLVRQLMLRCLTQTELLHWLTSPFLAESLHALAAGNPELRKWHRCVATPSVNDVVTPDPDDAGYLGVWIVALSLRANSRQCGRFAIRSDLLGRIRFPGTTWRIHVCDAQTGEALSRELIMLTLDQERVEFHQPDCEAPFLTLPRSSFLRLLANLQDHLDYDLATTESMNAEVKRLCKFGSSQVRYAPAHFPATPDHAEDVRHLIEQILMAMQDFSPEMYEEFCQYIRSVRGFEIEQFEGKVIGSFSDPTQPGVMNMNVTFLDDAPLLDPFCFTWFGHELAHTRNYMIDTVTYDRGEAFVLNRADMTPKIHRYGRRLPVRTLVQIPYVHLYEWELLMDAYEMGLQQLPWVNQQDPVAVVEEIRAEIADGFQLIDQHANLTPLGKVAIEHQENLYRQSKRRWSQLRRAANDVTWV